MSTHHRLTETSNKQVEKELNQELNKLIKLENEFSCFINLNSDLFDTLYELNENELSAKISELENDGTLDKQLLYGKDLKSTVTKVKECSSKVLLAINLLFGQTQTVEFNENESKVACLKSILSNCLYLIENHVFPSSMFTKVALVVEESLMLRLMELKESFNKIEDYYELSLKSITKLKIFFLSGLNEDFSIIEKHMTDMCKTKTEKVIFDEDQRRLSSLADNPQVKTLFAEFGDSLKMPLNKLPQLFHEAFLLVKFIKQALETKDKEVKEKYLKGLNELLTFIGQPFEWLSNDTSMIKLKELCLEIVVQLIDLNSAENTNQEPEKFKTIVPIILRILTDLTELLCDAQRSVPIEEKLVNKILIFFCRPLSTLSQIFTKTNDYDKNFKQDLAKSYSFLHKLSYLLHVFYHISNMTERLSYLTNINACIGMLIKITLSSDWLIDAKNKEIKDEETIDRVNIARILFDFFGETNILWTSLLDEAFKKCLIHNYAALFYKYVIIYFQKYFHETQFPAVKIDDARIQGESYLIKLKKFWANLKKVKSCYNNNLKEIEKFETDASLLILGIYARHGELHQTDIKIVNDAIDKLFLVLTKIATIDKKDKEIPGCIMQTELYLYYGSLKLFTFCTDILKVLNEASKQCFFRHKISHKFIEEKNKDAFKIILSQGKENEKKMFLQLVETLCESSCFDIKNRNYIFEMILDLGIKSQQDELKKIFESIYKKYHEQSVCKVIESERSHVKGSIEKWTKNQLNEWLVLNNFDESVIKASVLADLNGASFYDLIERKRKLLIQSTPVPNIEELEKAKSHFTDLKLKDSCITPILLLLSFDCIQ